ncbi:MAG TPA: glycoside hydrolase family 15 protein [Actinomycetota bacterium]|nr:glycoside hydrolase family 15 protein [Actinomycetota bacterium]
MNLPDIGDYGLLGDGRTAALSSSAGSIDWMCLPRFDSDPVFGRLVGGEQAGSFEIGVDGVRATSRRYRDRSSVLETTWTTDSAEVQLTEGMVLDVSGSLMPQLTMVRRLEARGGEATVRLRFDPRKGLPGTPPRTGHRHGTLLCSWGSLAIGLRTEPNVSVVPGQERTFLLRPGTPVTFVLGLAEGEPLVLVGADRALRALDETDRWWREWCRRVAYDGPFEDAVVRTLITLRLLTYTPSGAPVAAATTSLPERIGGSRNWDYRLSWPRDASIGLSGFLDVEMPDEAHSFMHWLSHASRLTRPRLDVVYTLDGKPDRGERELDGVPGYRGSRPVRLGNAASRQHQLDVYGWVLGAAERLVRSQGPLHPEVWRAMAGLADFVAGNWRKPDAGIWEMRGEPRHHVHSKLMGWLALDRAVTMSGSRRVRAGRLRRWLREREALGDEIRRRGLDAHRRSYVRWYGEAELDASLLLLPAIGFEEPGSPRIGGTISAIRRELGAGGPLLYRNVPGRDGLDEGEGAFLACSFWLADALARQGEIDEAGEVFEAVWQRSTSLGLFAEEMDPSTGMHLGNFPQALTHAALLQAAVTLSAATRERGSTINPPRGRSPGASRTPRAREA